MTASSPPRTYPAPPRQGGEICLKGVDYCQLSPVSAILAEAGVDMSHVIKTTVFLKDMNDFAAMNGVYATFFGEGGFPARSAVEVARLPKDALVEIEAIAVK